MSYETLILFVFCVLFVVTSIAILVLWRRRSDWIDDLQISPDGKWIAFVQTDKGGESVIVIIPISKDEHWFELTKGINPRWIDNSRIAFIRRGDIFVTDVTAAISPEESEDIGSKLY